MTPDDDLKDRFTWRAQSRGADRSAVRVEVIDEFAGHGRSETVASADLVATSTGAFAPAVVVDDAEASDTVVVEIGCDGDCARLAVFGVPCQP